MLLFLDFYGGVKFENRFLSVGVDFYFVLSYNLFDFEFNIV